MNTTARAAAVAIALSLLTFGPASAQKAERVYDNGSVWTIGYIETKPGMFDEYMAYLNGPWRAVQEAGKRRGDVVDYKILSVDSPRDNEPDVILLVQFKNMAVFDRSLTDLDAQTAAVFGSRTQSRQSQIKREEIRVLRGGLTARELKFIK